MDSALMFCMLLHKALIIRRSSRLLQPSWVKEHNKKILMKGYLIYLITKLIEESGSERRFWVHPIFTVQRRLAQGASDNLIRELERINDDKYFEYLRMTPDLFNELLELISSRIVKEYRVREPIPPITRLQICLRYLAVGGPMSSISFAFRVGLNTVSKIIPETCQAIWDVLAPRVFPMISEDMWFQKANEFEAIWNFPNCIGAIDGRHMEIQAPPDSGSTFYNYKGTHSIVLLAVADANALFTLVDIGAEGRRSDGGIFHSCEWGEHFRNNTFQLPAPRSLSNHGPIQPFVLVGDEAFALTEYMMRPYPKRGHLNTFKKVFNYRLSRARRIVECAFGILTARWRIFKQPMTTTLETSEKIVQATVCLHNFIMARELRKPHEDRRYIPSRPLQFASNDNDLTVDEDDEELDELLDERDQQRPVVANNAEEVRKNFRNYFLTRNVLSNQWDRALLNEC